MDYYWELVQHDGTRLEIPPEAVDAVKRKMANNEPINTRSMVIPINQVKYFRQTDKPFSTTKLLEEAAQAFKDPLTGPDGAVQARWVKKLVLRQKWDRYYAPSGYKRLEDVNGMVTVAYRVPVHLVDLQQVEYCTEDEILKLDNK